MATGTIKEVNLRNKTPASRVSQQEIQYHRHTIGNLPLVYGPIPYSQYCLLITIAHSIIT